MMLGFSSKMVISKLDDFGDFFGYFQSKFLFLLENSVKISVLRNIFVHGIHPINFSELDGWTKPTNVTPTLVAKGCPVYTSKFFFSPKPVLTSYRLSNLQVL